MYDTLNQAQGMAQVYANHYRKPFNVYNSHGGFWVEDASLVVAGEIPIATIEEGMSCVAPRSS